MHASINKWLGLSTLSAALLAAASGLHAEPQYKAERTGPLCQKAYDASIYNTKYLNFFTNLVQAENDWLFRTQIDLRTQFGTTPAGYSELKRLREALKSKGVELMIVYQPSRGLVHPSKLNTASGTFDYELAKRNYMTALEQFRSTGIWLTDLSPLFDERNAEVDYFFKGDHHWTPVGSERTAKLVAETLKEMPGFDEIPKKEFVSKRIGLLPKKGTLHKIASQLCGEGTGYAVQYVDRFETEPAGESASDDLFGEESQPEVVLVGTSNSGPAYNFAGFLQQYAGVDVLNMAVSGGGFEGGLMQYLTSKEFHEHPPKILIWEFGAHHDLSQKSFYRQAVPLVSNGCEGQKVVLQNKVELQPGSNEVLVNGQNQVLDLRGGDYQVDLTFSDPTVHEAHATFWYLNGRREGFKIEQSDRIDTGGRYVFELRNDADWVDLNLLAMEIEPPEEMPEKLSVEAKLCKRPTAGSADLTAKAE